METETAWIPARTRRQAMDWSLVLVSQGVVSTVDFSQEQARWGLLVGSSDHERALALIRQYRVENYVWRWRRQTLRSGVVFDWGSLAWPLLLAFFFALDSELDIHTHGHMWNVAVAEGAWWRLFTAVWLHGDLGHLLANASIGTLLLGLVMGAYGSGAGWLAAYCSGAGGNLIAGLLAQGTHRSLGASGMVMACLALLAVRSVRAWRTGAPDLRWTLTGVVGGIMLFVLLGLAPQTDVLAHFGGFVTGLMVGAMLAPWPNLARNKVLNVVAGVVLVLMTAVPWWLALRRNPLG
jgi:membrane associated rhomboid family serine protease